VDLHPDFRDLLAEFARSRVRFAVIGGYAVGHHAKPRATKDLDLLVSALDENLERVAEALERFGAPPSVVEAARRLQPTEVIWLGAPPVRVDVLRSIDGVDGEEAISRSELLKLGDLELRVMCLADLVANKRAAGRAQDLADVEVLERIAAKK
jgi:hypothetical protein